MIYNVKFSFRDKRLQYKIEAENEAMAKQRILSLIHFHSVEPIEPQNNIMDFLNGFRK